MIRNTAWVTIGAIVGQGAVLLGSSLFARENGPQSVAGLAIVITVAAVLGVIATLRFEVAMLVGDNDDVLSLFTISSLSTISISSIAAAIAFVAAQYFSGLSDYLNWQTVMLAGIGAGASQITIAQLNRSQKFKWIGGYRSFVGIAFLALSLSNYLTIEWAYIISILVPSVLFCIIHLIKNIQINLQQNIRVAAKYGSFPKENLVGAICDAFSISVPIWVIAHTYTAAQTGEYSQLFRLIAAPLSLFMYGFGQVLLRRLTEMHQSGIHLKTFIYSVYFKLNMASIAVLIGLLVFGLATFQWILGELFTLSWGVIAAISISLCFRLPISAISTVLLVKRMNRQLMFWQITHCVSLIVVLAVSSRFLSFLEFVWVIAFVDLILYTVYFTLIRKAIE